jgi:hypothetical protein
LPKIQRTNIPPGVLQHLLDRIQDRSIGSEQLKLLARWLNGEPEVPAGQWYKRFPGMFVCSDGELIRTFLLPSQHPKGKRVI